ncbi:hypothetical protein DOY81_013060 [Sarcophaga bullata]|nr:hypothetical protein DOY81_013060 [Sarcophaga bullata]
MPTLPMANILLYLPFQECFVTRKHSKSMLSLGGTIFQQIPLFVLYTNTPVLNENEINFYYQSL